MLAQDLCKEGQRLAYKYADICVRSNGNCTPLYYHIQECELCEQLRYGQSALCTSVDDGKRIPE